MRALSFALFVSIVASGAIAAPATPPQTPTPAVCKANLKMWSKANVGSLTVEQIMARMTEMVACADDAHHHRHSDNQVRAYLDEFYRVHTELANRTFDFITKHGLQDQFREEENGVSNPQTALNNSDGKQ